MQSVLLHARFQLASHVFSKQLLSMMLNPCFSANLPSLECGWLGSREWAHKNQQQAIAALHLNLSLVDSVGLE